MRRPRVRAHCVVLLALLLPYLAGTSALAAPSGSRAAGPLSLRCACVSAMKLAANPGKAAYDQALSDYHAGRNAQAATEFEQAISQGYRTPNVYYLLGLTFSRLKQWNDAVWAYDTARALDPAFAATHSTLTSKLASATKHGGKDLGPPAALRGVSTTPGSTSSPGAPQAATIAAALATDPVYVDPALGTAVDTTTLRNTASDLQQHSSTIVRFAFVGAPPAPYPTLGTYAAALFTRLGFHRAVVIVASPHGVAARTDRLSQSTTQDLVNASTAQFLQGSYTRGADSLARAIVSKADAQDSASQRTKTTVIAVIVLIVLAILAIFVAMRAARWRASYREAAAWRDSLTEKLTSTGDHVNYLPLEHPAHRAFLDASAYYSTASKIVDQLAKIGALQAAFSGRTHMNALGQARSSLQAAERSLQEAEAQSGGVPAGTASAPQDAAGAQPVPGGEITPPAEFLDRASGAAAPAACFFCAKPLDAARAQVVSVPVGNGTRRVMACDEHAADVRAGRQPQIRTVPDPAQGGKPMPWWGVPSYNPYRDYVYDPYYYRGGGIGWGDLLLFNALFDRPRDNIIYVDDDDDRRYDQAGYAGYDSGRPDSASFDAAGRNMPSAAEADFGTGGAAYSGGDRS